MNFKFDVGQHVQFVSQASIYEVYSRFAPEDGLEHQYYLKSATTPSYLQWALESDLREVSNA